MMPDRKRRRLSLAGPKDSGLAVGQRSAVPSVPNCEHFGKGDRGVEMMMGEHREAELMIHPECGCASLCLYKLHAGVIPRDKAYFLSTEGMVEHAQRSATQAFIAAAETGMVYRLRKECPQKTFLPVSLEEEYRYMKANNFDKLLASLRDDRIEVVLCDDSAQGGQRPHQALSGAGRRCRSRDALPDGTRVNRKARRPGVTSGRHHQHFGEDLSRRDVAQSATSV